MATLIKIAIYLINTLGSLYLLIIVLRFLLQIARADFYNPISQAIVKLTNPILIPLRRVIPGIFGVDVASLVFALLTQIIIIECIFLLAGYGMAPITNAIIWSLLGLVQQVLNIFFICLIVIFIASWVAPYSHHPVLVLIRQVVEPLLGPLRRLIPPVGGLDFSVFVAFMSLWIVGIVLHDLASAAGLPAGLFVSLI